MLTRGKMAEQTPARREKKPGKSLPPQQCQEIVTKKKKGQESDRFLGQGGSTKWEKNIKTWGHSSSWDKKKGQGGRTKQEEVLRGTLHREASYFQISFHERSLIRGDREGMNNNGAYIAKNFRCVFSSTTGKKGTVRTVKLGLEEKGNTTPKGHNTPFVKTRKVASADGRENKRANGRKEKTRNGGHRRAKASGHKAVGFREAVTVAQDIHPTPGWQGGNKKKRQTA